MTLDVSQVIKSHKKQRPQCIIIHQSAVITVAVKVKRKAPSKSSTSFQRPAGIRSPNSPSPHSANHSWPALTYCLYDPKTTTSHLRISTS